jgi:hypothetical protein
MSKRPSLATFSPKPIEANGGKVTASAEDISSAPAAKSYPKVSVYLEAQEVRTLKLIGVDTGQRISDICAVAIREWLERNGHSRGKLYKA